MRSTAGAEEKARGPWPGEGPGEAPGHALTTVLEDGDGEGEGRAQAVRKVGAAYSSTLVTASVEFSTYRKVTWNLATNFPPNLRSLSIFSLI